MVDAHGGTTRGFPNFMWNLGHVGNGNLFTGIIIMIHGGLINIRITKFVMLLLDVVVRTHGILEHALEDIITIALPTKKLRKKAS